MFSYMSLYAHILTFFVYNILHFPFPLISTRLSSTSFRQAVIAEWVATFMVS